MTQTELGYLLCLARCPSFGPVTLKKLRNHFSSYEELFKMEEKDLRQSGLSEKTLNSFLALRPALHPETEFLLLEKHGVQAITQEDEQYPSLLKEIYDPPPILFARGNLPSNDGLFLSVVGTRKPTRYGQQVVQTLVSELAQNGFVIVSGLAYGIDALAHEATCRAGGKTIAVLGSGVDDASLYPKPHRALAQKITETGGALLSEFPIGTEPRKHHFPFRNRLIAGISFGTLIIEAAQKSGSLITAKSALESNREVFAVPGPITSPLSVGPNNLLKMGAHVITDAQDISSFQGLKISLHKKEVSPLSTYVPTNTTEAHILEHLSTDPLHIDDLVRKTELDLSLVTAQMTLMEMNGIIKQVGGMYYVKVK